MIRILQQKGVAIPNPESVLISDDVNPDRISGENVTLYTGTKLFGKKTLVLPNCSIGYEAPVTLEDTLVGENTRLHGGYFSGAVFAGNNVFGSGAHVRQGTILEEAASAGHTVGLKQTLLFPFVTLGSLINFCDCFMAGGTSRKDHSEVGSSFVHFNYTPNQDKATPSMMGDVPQGVMLRSRPIFLGGQGGIVGPVRLAYGCITAAGSIIRKNEKRNDRILLGGGLKDYSLPRQPDVYKNVSHIFNNNILYMAGLCALRHWYMHVRPLFAGDDLSRELVAGMQHNLDCQMLERMTRFEAFCIKLEQSKQALNCGTSSGTKDSIAAAHDAALNRFPAVLDVFQKEIEGAALSKQGQDFVNIVKEKSANKKRSYLKFIQCLMPDEVDAGISWLSRIESGLSEPLMI